MLLCRNGQAQDPTGRESELERHIWGTFVEGKATVALGGTGVVVSGCEACRKRFGTNSQYLWHLADDVLPVILRKASEIAGVTTQVAGPWLGDCRKRGEEV